MTKRTSVVLGGLGGLLVIAAAGAALVVAHGRTLDRESRQYVDEAIPAIARRWDVAEIRRRASPEFRAAVKDADLEKMAQFFLQKRGRLLSYEGAKGEAVMSVTPRGKTMSAAYMAHATLEAGPADFQVSLVKHGTQWELLGFDVRWPGQPSVP